MNAAPAAAATPQLEEPRLAAWLRPLVYLCAAFAFAYPLSTLQVALAIALGAWLGALAGRTLARSHWRLAALTAFALLALGSVSALRSALLASDSFAAWLGPASALSWADAVGFGGAAACIAAGLRAAALRQRLFRAFEVAFAGVAFAQLVASHRGGAINRPFELADSIIAQGGDPTLALLAVGAVAAVASVLLLLSERSPLRSILHLLLAVALLALVLGTTRMLGLPRAEVGSNGLGLGPKKPSKPEGGGRPSGKQSAQRTNNDELEFRDNYNQNGPQVPLAVVLLHDDYSPPGGLYHFRQSVFSQYNGKRLVAATRGDVDQDIAPGFVSGLTRLAEVPNEHGDRVELETTVAMLADHNRPFALESPIELRPEQNPDPGRFRRAYRVTSEAFSANYQDLFGRGVGDPSWSEQQREHYLEAPKDPRYGALAEQIVGSIPEGMRDDPIARGMMVALWLGHEGIYSLRSGHANAEDPTADFLFGDRTGYCVHFAHAAVYLMRALGIPSRVGAGYAVEESARQGGSAILLSGANSHAWPEMYVSGTGWVVVDVSPERTLDPPPAPPDPDLQRLLGEMARGERPLPQGEQKLLEPMVAAVRNLPRALARVLAVLLPALLLLGYGVKLWRRFAPVWASPRAAPRVAYRAELDRLSELRLRRRFGESREAFAARVAAQSPSFSALTQRHVAAHFAREQQLERGPLRTLALAVRRELARAVPLRRRLLGLLNPFSWLVSR
jgi:transglutaminase-like putative cysteine protease